MRGRLICGICPHGCRLEEGQMGICHARRNSGGRIVPLAYGKPCAVAVDPMEKKPLFHFRPGTRILSLGMAGCNLRCRNCQNAEISQASPDAVRGVRLMPDDLVALMRREGVESVAYTYTEPLVAFEYVRDCAQAVRATLRTLARANVVLEVTNLVIPGFNDSDQDLQAWCKFVAGGAGPGGAGSFLAILPVSSDDGSSADTS